MKKLYNLFCENCGNRFRSENPHKRFHSPSCAALYVQRKRMEKRDDPTHYHDDDCDCIVCLARTQPGGLDYDPSNDDAEFEEHERQVLRDKGIS